MKIDQLTNLEISGFEPIKWQQQDMHLICHACRAVQATHHLHFRNDIVAGTIQVCKSCLEKYKTGELEP